MERISENKFIKLEGMVVDSVDERPELIYGDKDGEVEWNIRRIADLVWDKLGIDGTGAVIGLIDTGATWDHPALRKWRV